NIGLNGGIVIDSITGFTDDQTKFLVKATNDIIAALPVKCAAKRHVIITNNPGRSFYNNPTAQNPVAEISLGVPPNPNANGEDENTMFPLTHELAGNACANSEVYLEEFAAGNPSSALASREDSKAEVIANYDMATMVRNGSRPHLRVNQG